VTTDPLVSKETAEAMAVGARQRTGSTYALSTTGIAGPGQGGETAPVGTVYVGIADANGSRVAHRQFLGDRESHPAVHHADGVGHAAGEEFWACRPCLLRVLRIQSDIVFRATGAIVSSIFEYSAGLPVSLVLKQMIQLRQLHD